ncbi:Kielin/chordin-like protein, partial [Gryllus bimaculatus]
MTDNKDTASETQSITANLGPDISTTVERQAVVETTCPKEVVVVLHRLPEGTVNRILSRRSSSSDVVKKSSKDILEKCLLPKLESRLTEWIKTKVQKNGDRLLTRKVVKRAKRIFERLKVQGGEKYKNVKFVPSRKWYYRYRMRAGLYNKELSKNPSLMKKCLCNVVCEGKNGSLTVIPESSDEDDCSHTIISDGDEDWCSRLKSDLINEKARDLMIDTVTPCPFLTCTSGEDQKSTSGRSLQELRRHSDTPMPNFEREMEVGSLSSDSDSDLLEISEIVFCPKAASSRVDISDKIDEDVKPVVITLDDEVQPTSTASTISFAAFATNGCSSSDKNTIVSVGYAEQKSSKRNPPCGVVALQAGRGECRVTECAPPPATGCGAGERLAVAPGACCPTCVPTPTPAPADAAHAQCVSRGETFRPGQRWVRREGGCHNCVCQKGNITCRRKPCSAPCSHPYRAPGRCCPRCHDCLVDGRRLRHGAALPVPLPRAHARAPGCRLCACQ